MTVYTGIISSQSCVDLDHPLVTQSDSHRKPSSIFSGNFKVPTNILNPLFHQNPFKRLVPFLADVEMPQQRRTYRRITSRSLAQ